MHFVINTFDTKFSFYNWDVPARDNKRRGEYYTADLLKNLSETTPETCIVEFLREVGFFYDAINFN